ILVTFAGAFALASAARSGRNLTAQDVRELRPKLDANTIDQKIDLLFQAERIRLAKTLDDGSNFTWRSAVILGFVGTPVLIIVCCFVYLLLRCYPKGTFAWGDMADKYKRILALRRTLWTAVLLSLGVGIVGNVFVCGRRGY